MNKLFNQIIKFGLVGGIAFVIDYSLLYILTDFLEIHYLISSVISFTVSFIFNYILSIKWVFNVSKKQTYKEVIIFLTLSLIGLLINQIVLFIATDYIKIHYMISKIIATVIVMIWNFITRKIFIED